MATSPLPEDLQPLLEELLMLGRRAFPSAADLPPTVSAAHGHDALVSCVTTRSVNGTRETDIPGSSSDTAVKNSAGKHGKRRRKDKGPARNDRAEGPVKKKKRRY
jgi:hypothetical protein